MKAIAKRDIQFNSGDQFILGNKYDVRIDNDNYQTFIMTSLGREACFCGEPKHLTEDFDFVEG
jgi:hypothetical protein